MTDASHTNSNAPDSNNTDILDRGRAALNYLNKSQSVKRVRAFVGEQIDQAPVRTSAVALGATFGLGLFIGLRRRRRFFS